MLTEFRKFIRKTINEMFICEDGDFIQVDGEEYNWMSKDAIPFFEYEISKI